METFTLPNGSKVPMEDLVSAVLATAKLPAHFLDAHTGDVCAIHDRVSYDSFMDRHVRSDWNDERYFEIKKMTRDSIHRSMHGFIKEIVNDDSPIVAAEAAYVLETFGPDKALDYLKKMNTEAFGWDDWIQEDAWAHATHWLGKLPMDIEVTVSYKNCGNCPLCIAQQNGASEEELQALFAKLKNDPAVDPKKHRNSKKLPPDESTS